MIWLTGLAGALSTGLFLAVVWHPPRARIIWNASASAPLGLYRIAAQDHPMPGDLVAIRPPELLERFLADRRYLPRGVPMLKYVAGLEGALICRKGIRVTLNGKRVALARKNDNQGRRLPVWHGCHRVGASEVFLLNPAADSMDGRYFGVMPDAGLIGRAIPLLTRDTPVAPLRWHGWATTLSLPPEPKG